MMNNNFLIFPMKFALLLWIFNLSKFASFDLDPQNFKIYGPGLDSSITLPVRYFFIQLVNKSDKNVTIFNSNESKDPIEVIFQYRLTGNSFYIYHDIFYLNNGLFVVRYRLHKSIINNDIVMSLIWKPLSIYMGNQSFLLKSPIFSEKCHCPQDLLNIWLSNKIKCKNRYTQIENDFREFQSFDPEKSFNRFHKLFYPFTSVAVCRYIIKDNRIFRKCFGQHTGFKLFSDAVLLSLSKKVKLPNIDFLFNLGDWPLSKRTMKKFAILSWCGSLDSYDIVIPSYETMEWVLEMMGRVYLDVFTTLKDSIFSWKEKSEKAFWRGRDSSQSRLNLVKLSINNPEIIDARLTNMFFFTNDSTLGNLVKPVPFTSFFKYKYLINMDGTVAAYRFPLSLAGGSLLFKEESVYYEYIYSRLIPNKHYISIKSDLSDLFEKLNWAKSHDAESQKIAENARNFITSEFMPIDILCYFGSVLETYKNCTSKYKTLSIPHDYELVTDNDEKDCKCSIVSSNKQYHDDL